MERVRVREELPASADEVWRRIRDFGDVSAWAPEAKVLSVEGAGEGALRRIDTQMGLFVERCEFHDDAARRFQYALLECPVPFRDYVATVELTPQGDGGSLIEWSCEFACEPEAAEPLRQNVEATYRDGFIASLRRTLERAS